MNNINTYIIGITGGTCSGKSYLSKSLQDFYGKDKLSIIKLDSYYHDLSHFTIVFTSFLLMFILW